jgi:hypothetical protein
METQRVTPRIYYISIDFDLKNRKHDHPNLTEIGRTARRELSLRPNPSHW